MSEMEMSFEFPDSFPLSDSEMAGLDDESDEDMHIQAEYADLDRNNEDQNDADKGSEHSQEANSDQDEDEDDELLPQYHGLTETRKMKRLRKLRWRRQLVPRPNITFTLKRDSNRESHLAHHVGDRALIECATCQAGHGPWINCVVVADELLGACTNCWYGNLGSQCSFREDDSFNNQTPGPHSRRHKLRAAPPRKPEIARKTPVGPAHNSTPTPHARSLSEEHENEDMDMELSDDPPVVDGRTPIVSRTPSRSPPPTPHGGQIEDRDDENDDDLAAHIEDNEADDVRAARVEEALGAVTLFDGDPDANPPPPYVAPFDPLWRVKELNEELSSMIELFAATRRRLPVLLRERACELADYRTRVTEEENRGIIEDAEVAAAATAAALDAAVAEAEADGFEGAGWLEDD